MQKMKNIAIVSHDAKKADMKEWVKYNIETLFVIDKDSTEVPNVYATGTTGGIIKKLLDEYILKNPDKKYANLIILKSGPLGGDQQIGSLIVNNEIDILFFFTDPMTMQAHDTDIKALIRLCGVYNTVIACTRSTADFVISSKLFTEKYQQKQNNYDSYITRVL